MRWGRILFLGIGFLFIISIAEAQYVTGTVEINLHNLTVYQAEFLHFEIVLNKTVGIGAIAYVDFWVESETAEIWGADSFSTYLAEAPSTLRIPKNIYIFSSQPPGKYFLKVRVKFTNYSSPITTSQSFYVMKSPLEFKGANITITSWPKEINGERSWSNLLTVSVKNLGEEVLHNVSLLVYGISSEWLIISPVKYDVLKPGEELVFSMRITIPPNAETRQYNLSIHAVTAEGVSDRKESLLQVFASRRELIESDLKKLEARLNELKLKLQQAIFEGKNTTQFSALIQRAETQINFAKEYLNVEKYNEALVSLSAAKDFLDEAEILYPNLQFLPGVIKESYMNFFLLLSAIIIPSVLIFLYHKWSERRLLRVLSYYGSELLEAMEKTRPGAKLIPKSVSREEIEALKGKLEGEKEGILRRKLERLRQLVRIVEKEYAVGNISKEAYEEVRNKCMQKIEEIKKELGEGSG
ncbi:MAG: hypothetical protein OH339_02140 [Candidatus Parvarchaeota archaeon]|nr:hypothetical protein [Candidatus Haiyanarchaeum thermophilum]MCW1303868.1 hypothetical protein [Candidatus Haiyanarchaeum thermophilum]MCW1306516.1 hypothetical protein [Candidatus Haiyanarchaeum thermophilum]MCW1306929.1 hypothetical protein [Candidatus Haiyanarchaeum thermophilum]MCW1307600.1 hypothetical protein [Candidatus Haiyanarchaeum thermophilum]